MPGTRLAPRAAELNQKMSLPSRGSVPGQVTNPKPDLTQIKQMNCIVFVFGFVFLSPAKVVNEKLKPY